MVTDGPFSLCRNPLYLFSFVGAEGVMLTARNFSLAVLMIPLFGGYYHSREVVAIDLGIMRSVLLNAGAFLVLIALVRIFELARLA